MEEKRKFPRIQAVNLVSVQEIQPEEVIQEFGHLGSTVNLSRGGMLFESKQPLPLLSTVKISMTIKDDLIDVVGRVVRLEEIEKDRIAIAIQFLKLDEKSEQILDQYLKEKQEHQQQ